MCSIVSSCIFVSLVCFLAAKALAGPVAPYSPNDVESIKHFNLKIGSRDYTKGQVASALINELLQVSIDSGVIGSELFFCPESEGVYSDPFDCAHYFNCSDGFSTRVKCPEKLAFDNETLTCIDRSNVTLCTDMLNDSEYKCPFNGLHIYPMDCSKFYICVEKMAYITKCPEGDNFDNALRLCIPKDQALCLSEKITFPEITANITSSTNVTNTN